MFFQYSSENCLQLSLSNVGFLQQATFAQLKKLSLFIPVLSVKELSNTDFSSQPCFLYNFKKALQNLLPFFLSFPSPFSLIPFNFFIFSFSRTTTRMCTFIVALGMYKLI